MDLIDLNKGLGSSFAKGILGEERKNELSVSFGMVDMAGQYVPSSRMTLYTKDNKLVFLYTSGCVVGDWICSVIIINHGVMGKTTSDPNYYFNIADAYDVLNSIKIFDKSIDEKP